MTNRGLTLGKFAPLHRGHQLVIETGLAEMDEMVVVIYDAPESTVPVAVRAGWIHELYPSVRVIEAFDGPTEVGYTPELMRAHERYLLSLPGVEGITHFYSSEPYGGHISAALAAVDRRVDEARVAVPISGTEIRMNPYRFRQFVDPLVYRELITNVVFLGAPSTGKTTLAERLAERFETQWMPEFGREYWEKHQVDRRLNPDQLLEIAVGHLEREDRLLEQSNCYLFTDTNALTTATFAQHYHQSIHPTLVKLANAAAARYDVVFLCETDIPYEDSWDRSGDMNRSQFQRQVVSDLHQRGISYTTLHGTVAERIEHVDRVLSRFQKFAHRSVGARGADEREVR